MVRSWNLGTDDEQLSDRPGYELVGVVGMPPRAVGPGRAIGRRVLFALAVLLVVVFAVYVDRGGYRDANGDGISLLDCFYYATVSLSTTGYGDITPASDSARLTNIVLITPLRVVFLIVLIGTTLEVLTERSRQAFRIRRWRRTVRDHLVVVGFGTKGRSAVEAFLAEKGGKPEQIVVVDTDRAALSVANARGLVTVHGSATRADVLRVAGVPRARAVVVAPNRDDTAVLVTLTARTLAPRARILVALHEMENVRLLKQSGADQVVVSSETAGRLLGIATVAPHVVDTVEDLLTPETGLALDERPVTPAEEGRSPRELSDIVLALVRDGRMRRMGEAGTEVLRPGDRLLYVRNLQGEDGQGEMGSLFPRTQ